MCGILCHTTLTVKYIIEECAKYTALNMDLNMPNNITETFGKVQVIKIIKFLIGIKVINVQRNPL